MTDIANLLREALEEITEANEQTPVKTYQRMETIAREALATTEDV
jgi:ribosomal protein S19